MDALVDGNPTIGWRQLAVVDREGRTAFFHGERIISIHNAAQSASSCAIGNIVRNDGVPQAMVEPSRLRLTSTWRNVWCAGWRQERRPAASSGRVKSAALLVVHEHSFPLVDLRVEFDRNPLAELRFLWEVSRPQVDLYVRRAADPDSIPHPES